MNTNYSNIPPVLKQQEIWSFSKGKGQPLSFRGGNASISDPSTWCDFLTAVDAMTRAGGDTLHIACTHKTQLAAIDFDDYVVNGALTNEALLIKAMSQTYLEISPSGNGVKMIGFVGEKLGRNAERKNDKGQKLELFSGNHWTSVTGNVIDGRKELLDMQAAHDWAAGHIADGKRNSLFATGKRSKTATDDEVIFKMLRAKNAQKFEEIFRGDALADYNDDESAVDMALACGLSFYTQELDQIKRLMEASYLARPKWENHKRYLDITIVNALERLSDVFEGDFTKVPYGWTIDNWLNDTYEENSASEIVESWKLQTFTGTDALRFNEPTVWLVEKYIERGSMNIFFGDPGGFKSLLTMSMAAHVATGKSWLREKGSHSGYRVQQGRVLWIDKDNGRDRSKRNLGAILRGIESESAPNFDVLSMSSPPFTIDTAMVNALIDLINDRQYDLVALDNLGLISFEDENSSAMAHTLSEFRRVAEETGAAVIIIHHANKGNNGGQSKMRGSTSISAALDYSFYVKRIGENDKLDVKCVKHRSARVPTSEMLFHFEHWTGTEDLYKASFEYNGRKNNEVEEAIIDHLIVSGASRMTDLRDATMQETNKGIRAVNDAINLLLADGVLIETQDKNDKRIKVISLV